MTCCVAVQVRCRDAAGEETCYAKGAVESILEKCVFVQSSQGAETEMGEKERRRVLDAASALGMKGRRYVLSCYVILLRVNLCEHVEDERT